MRYFVYLSYDGTRFHGWQIQPNGISVESEIERCLSTILRTSIDIVGAGRTDAGVHARNYVAHFDYETANLHTDANLLYKLNCILPYTINIQRIAIVGESAHARFDAVKRTYRYYLTTQKDVFNYPLMHRVQALDFEKMNEAAALLANYTDFTSFSKLHTDVKTNNCTIFEAKWVADGDRITFTICANRFLRNMVRAIVGTLIEIGRGKLTVDDFCKIIESKDRGKAGSSAPANALFLEEIEYPYQF